ncbi:neuronal acetylcholine receptor subunit alpha-3-like [Ruditapes philippinarum]|uniref:neuronal acetylcholine receptor subunit alpha-3-like n=1 Tax=Ruditapes philippinarum TaxID=129788 RepID=UPI00295BC8F1|nr:neuronal acetylcholine receptor subunit alpha-3-like [Ruditapes philippinarum]
MVIMEYTTVKSVFFSTCIVLSSAFLPDEQALMQKIITDQHYDNSVRPVYNSSRNVEVSFGFTLIQIMDMDEKNQLLVLNAWLEMIWIDERISWNISEYNGLEIVRLPAKLLWLPDIVLYNNADDYTAGFMPINAMVDYNGTVFWPPPARLKSSCKVDITYFPFDHQVCELKFGSWSYDKAQVDLLTKSGVVEVSRYVTNGEWMLTKYEIIRNEVVYPISPAIYPDVTVILTIQRRILYYVLNILFPCFWLNILSVLTFCLPPDAGEKITLSITVLLSYSVFMLLVAESMPPTSEFVPLIGIYLTVSMAVASVSVILTVVVLKLHHCSPNQKKIPRWVRHIVLGYLAKLVRCECISTNCKLSRMRKTPSSDAEIDMKELQTKLLRQMEAVTQKNGNNCLNSESVSRNHVVNSNMRNPSINDVNTSKMNLDLRDYSVSNRSSMVEEESSVNLRRDKSMTTMEEILKYLKILVVKSDAEDAEKDVEDEWKQVALVVDRLFFWTFMLITIFSTVIILVIVPSFKYVADDGI